MGRNVSNIQLIQTFYYIEIFEEVEEKPLSKKLFFPQTDL